MTRSILVTVLCAATLHAADPATDGPIVGSPEGKAFSLLLPEGGRLVGLKVNLARAGKSDVVKGLRLAVEDAAGKASDLDAGPADGTWSEAVAVPKGSKIVGVSGKAGPTVLGSIRFHFADGSASPAFGTGPGTPFKQVLRGYGGSYRGSVAGLRGTTGEASVSGIGLKLVGKDGAEAELTPFVAPGDLSLTIRGDIDGDMAPVAGKLAALFYEGYPPLLERFDNAKKPASRRITIVFKQNMKVPAYCTGAEISVSVEWLRSHPEDVALITHELTHSVQLYPPGGPGWLTEGIADYTRKLYGPKVQPDWSLPERLTARQSYKDSYRTSARFLEWLDAKHPGTVDEVHRKLQAREYQPELFAKLTGKGLDELWGECVKELGAKK